MNQLYKILSISVISASKMYVQGRSLAFSSDVATAYSQRGDKKQIEDCNALREKLKTLMDNDVIY
jgi:hypothetical protein